MNAIKSNFKQGARWLALGALSLFAHSAAFAQASTDNAFKFGESDLEEFDQTGGAIRVVVRFAFYIMYLLGGIMIAASGFKLKAGDMPGFWKMCAGGVVVFISPFIIDALLKIGDSGPDAATGS